MASQEPTRHAPALAICRHWPACLLVCSSARLLVCSSAAIRFIHQMETETAPSDRDFPSRPSSALVCLLLLLVDWLLLSSATANLSCSEILPVCVGVGAASPTLPPTMESAPRYSATPACTASFSPQALARHVHCTSHPAMCPSCCTFLDYLHYNTTKLGVLPPLLLHLHPQPSAIHLSIVRHHISTPPACLPAPLSYRTSPSLLVAIV